MPSRFSEERDATGTAAPVPRTCDLSELKRAAAGCRACPLWERGTQTVFGEGEPGAPLLLVGEQPGDREDREGRPFVGPAGRVLDQALLQAGIDRSSAYVTNAVKHFKWVPQGKRRLHTRPNSREIGACLPWLDAEIEAVRPLVLVAMGSTAAQALFGREVRVTRDRGIPITSKRAPHSLVTVHPSLILRMQTDGERQGAMDLFVRDLAAARDLLKK